MMANVLKSHIGFPPGPVSHAPSPFGFGFGLGPSSSTSMSSSAAWPTGGSTPGHTPGHTNPAAFQQLAASQNSQTFVRVPKRRHDPDDDGESSRRSLSNDDSMDRSPTPERPKRAAPKRARVVNSSENASSKGTSSEGDKDGVGGSGDDVDIGLLLASLPREALFPLLEALLKAQPSLMTTILPLIPRPTLQTAQQVLAQSVKRLKDAYPYSASPPQGQAYFSFGSENPTHSVFGSSPMPQASSQPSMRDSYITSRLAPHVSDFVSVCVTYFPYFSCVTPPTQSADSASTSTRASATTTIQSLHKGYPLETFSYLSTVTNHIIEMPPLTRAQVVPLIMPRLTEEWKAWVNRIDDVVNTKSGMFGRDAVTGWIRDLENMSKAKANGVSEVMKEIMNGWIAKLGWMVGLSPGLGHQPMEEV